MRFHKRWAIVLVAIAGSCLGLAWVAWTHGWLPVAKEARARRLVRSLREQPVDDPVRTRKEIVDIGEPAVQPLIDLARDKSADPQVRFEAISMLGALGPKAEDAVPTLIDCLQESHWMVSESSAIALGSIGPSAVKAVPSLINALGSEDTNLRWYAASSLGLIGPGAESAIPDLNRALEDKDATVRCFAAAALVRLGRAADQMPFLLNSLKDKKVRNAAVLALGYLGPLAKEAIPALCGILANDDNYSVQRNAAYALGEMGAAGRDTIPYLRKATGDEMVREAAEAALRKIGP